MKKCPQCDVDVDLQDPSVLLDQMGRDWHTECWEAFQMEYNDVLDTTDPLVRPVSKTVWHAWDDPNYKSYIPAKKECKKCKKRIHIGSYCTIQAKLDAYKYYGIYIED